MDRLDEIKRDMAFMGWKGPADTGFSHKVDVNGETIARHHDDTWKADVEEATNRAERNAARHTAVETEFRRRERAMRRNAAKPEQENVDDHRG